MDALGWRTEVDLALSPADVGRGRPAPDLVLGAMARLGVDDPGAVAVVGDTVSDLEAGHAAGAGAVVGVLSGAHDAAALAGRVADSGPRRPHRPGRPPRAGSDAGRSGSLTWYSRQKLKRVLLLATQGRGATPGKDLTMNDVEHMRRALAQAATVRSITAPNPWVGSVVVPPDFEPDGGTVFAGATAPPGGPHAEVTALAAAGEAARGSTLYVTLEPCAHHGRTPPCSDAIIAAGVARVVVGIEDPDELVAGRGLAALRAAGIDVTVGVAADEVAEQLAPYCKHRRTGQPWVVLKMAASLDGRTAAPDGTSRWITGEAARRDAHRLRAQSDAVLVGAGTVRVDDPTLTVRLDDEDGGEQRVQPLRVVLGQAPSTAKVRPPWSWPAIWETC